MLFYYDYVSDGTEQVIIRMPICRRMKQDIRVLLIDGYIDDPAALGVPPYISPISRAVAGAAMEMLGC